MHGLKWRILAAGILCVSMALPVSAQNFSAEFGNGRIIIESGPRRDYDRRYDHRHDRRDFDRRSYQRRDYYRDPDVRIYQQRHERSGAYRRHDHDRRVQWR